MDERIAIVNKFLTEVMKKEKVILPQHSLVEDLGLSSLQFMDLIEKIETEFNVIVPIQKLRNIKNVSDLHQAVTNLEEFCK